MFIWLKLIDIFTIWLLPTTKFQLTSNVELYVAGAFICSFSSINHSWHPYLVCLKHVISLQFATLLIWSFAVSRIEFWLIFKAQDIYQIGAKQVAAYLTRPIQLKILYFNQLKIKFQGYIPRLSSCSRISWSSCLTSTVVITRGWSGQQQFIECFLSSF
jgi:hypothetical protein